MYIIPLDSNYRQRENITRAKCSRPSIRATAKLNVAKYKPPFWIATHPLRHC